VVTLFLLGWIWIVVRFYGLDVSPPGFFMDEAAPAVHAMCLAETGKDADGKPWPLYSSAAGGGHHPLTLLAFDIAWTGVFGTSRAAFRAVSAFWILLTAFGLFSIARDLAAMMPATIPATTPGRSEGEDGNPAAEAFPWLVLLAALLSPWGFQFSRVAWESPLAPAFMVLSLMGILRMYRSGKPAFAWATFAGFCAAASMTSYPPLRAVVPLVLPPGWARASGGHAQLGRALDLRQGACRGHRGDRYLLCANHGEVAGGRDQRADEQRGDLAAGLGE
jgi:hypothetical protein